MPLLGTWNVLILMIIVSTQEKYVKTGAVKTVFAPEEFATVCLAFQAMIARKPSVHLISTSTQQTTAAEQVVLQGLTRTCFRGHVCHAQVHAKSV